jgi:hypothetical protein
MLKVLVKEEGRMEKRKKLSKRDLQKQIQLT